MDVAKPGDIQNSAIHLWDCGAIGVSCFLFRDEPLFQGERQCEPGLFRCLWEWPGGFLSIDGRSIRRCAMGAGL